MLLKDKVVIVSGIGAGLGIEVARVAAELGARVAMSCRTVSFLEQSEKELRDAGHEVMTQRCDISSEEDCQAFARAVVDKWGKIDALVNNAALTLPFAPFEEANWEEWHKCHNITMFGSLRMARASVPGMKKAGGGYIVNVSSMAHKKPLPMQAAYASAKGGLEAATKHMALELGKYNIRVNTARMGWMDGPPVRAYLGHIASEQGKTFADIADPIAANISLGTIPDDRDCAKAVVFLCTDMAAAVSGAALDINGGEWMP
ncbi:SDR family oxidoreductase [Novosphingobium bradum]|uniref:SDR family oxidoreductase n=1 Tax=Novosphingobium bradum TaxID=1737444 RepID=A0ABV7IMM5_9SPHN